MFAFSKIKGSENNGTANKFLKLGFKLTAASKN
jgi:hypothetical protein